MEEGPDAHGGEQPAPLDPQQFPVHVACSAADDATVVQLLEAGWDPNQLDPDSRTPLVHAIVGKSRPCIDALLRAGANIDYQDHAGLTACHWAASYSFHKALKQLIEAGAHWDLRDGEGRTPLHWTSTTETVKSMEALLKRSGAAADPDVISAGDNEGVTALHFSVSQDHLAQIELLIRYSADATRPDGNGRNCLHWAVDCSTPDSLLTVLEYTGEATNLPDAAGDTPLHCAVTKGNPGMVQALVQHPSCDTNCLDAARRTSLHRAAAYGSYDIAEILLHYHADQGMSDQEGASALHYAVQQPETLNCAELLMSAGKEGDVPDVEGRHPLSWAVMSGNVDAVKLFVASGFDLNHADNDGRTALHLAVLSGATESAQVLASGGADVNCRDGVQQTPLFYCAESGQVELLPALVSNKCDLDAADSDGRTTLHMTAASGNLEFVDALVSKGSNPSVRDAEGKTPLCWASYQGRSDVVQYLIAHGADVNNQDNDGLSPLHWAALQGHSDIVKFLLDEGANPNVMEQSEARLTPSDYARDQGHEDIVRLLEERGGHSSTAITGALPAAIAELRVTEEEEEEVEAAPPSPKPTQARVPVETGRPSDAEQQAAAVTIQSTLRAYLARREHGARLERSLAARAVPSHSPQPEAAEFSPPRTGMPKVVPGSAADSADAQLQLDRERMAEWRREHQERLMELNDKQGELLQHAEARKVTIQRERQRIARLRDCVRASVCIQSHWRGYMVRRTMQSGAPRARQHSRPQGQAAARPKSRKGKGRSSPAKGRRSPSKATDHTASSGGAAQRARQPKRKPIKKIMTPTTASQTYRRDGGWHYEKPHYEPRSGPTLMRKPSLTRHKRRLRPVKPPPKFRAGRRSTSPPRRVSRDDFHSTADLELTRRLSATEKLASAEGSSVSRNALKAQAASLRAYKKKGWNDDTRYEPRMIPKERPTRLRRDITFAPHANIDTRLLSL